ncbi:MAG TPA: GtrA family protein [Bacteroidales bacterium]|nr:GtrA family protein [Bacteroidales bacterium]HOH83567.1 GtrA family protein [Bacteroidales bacterium]HPB24881.1 GtrA family protein [Bacteroidales bacterium]HPI29774.1 GtrA family protein [Bacteroidales bacterium]HQN15255.1 GtrA family protein [Bacteroidales bacterium]
MFNFFDKVFFLKFIKFGVVGGSGVLVDFGTTYVCKEWLKIPKYISNAMGFTVAATWNYIFNRIWTFESKNPEIAWEFFRFFSVSLVGLGINTLILWLLVSKFKMNFYLSKLFAIGVVMIWNFALNLLVTFR